MHIRSNFGVHYLAQGYFDMQLSSAPGEPGFDLLITSRPILPAGLQPPLYGLNIIRNICINVSLTKYIFRHFNAEIFHVIFLGEEMIS